MSNKNDEIEVVSEINTFLTESKDVKPILSDKNKVAKLSFSIPRRTPITVPPPPPPVLQVDSDGDLILPRKPSSSSPSEFEDLSLLIEYENSTSLSLVGLQVWRGAFLLSDFIIHFHSDPNYFPSLSSSSILELGSGTGMTSCVASIYFPSVTSTDLPDPSILSLITANVTKHNHTLTRTSTSGSTSFQVLPLDFLNPSWDSSLQKIVASSEVILAADVVYHVKITEGFVATLKKLIETGDALKSIFIAMEKRYCFTLEEMETVAPMYAHFMDQLETVLGIYPGCLEKPLGSVKLTMQFVPLNFPQYFNYERTSQLVLIHIKVCRQGQKGQ